LEGFVDARILVVSANKDGHATVKKADDALLRTWPKRAVISQVRHRDF
jgi:hypothetical protein